MSANEANIMIDNLLKQSETIIDEAITNHQPHAIVGMFSGGNDSRLAYHVTRACGVKFDALVHAKTGTGIAECGQYCRQFAECYNERLIIADYGAGDNYIKRLFTNGWPGRGQKAHQFAYHICKATPFRKAISRHFRQGKRGRPVLMINGVRKAESRNRRDNSVYGSGYENRDPAAKTNIWLNVVWDWDDKSKREFLAEQTMKQSIVAATIHRSGDCMCGTNQTMEEGEGAAFWFPEWGEWWRGLRRDLFREGFAWDWGQHPPPGHKNQLPLFADFMPACLACNNEANNDT